MLEYEMDLFGENVNLGKLILPLILLVSALYYLWWRKPHQNFPPGPRGVPFLGVIPFVGQRAELSFTKWSQQRYGPIMSVRLGTKDSVMLCSYDVVYEAFVKKSRVFAGRQPLHAFVQSSRDYGIIFRSYSEVYKRQRHFGVQTLKKLGFAKKDVEHFILDEAKILVQTINKNSKLPVDMLPLLTRTTSNIISMIVLGRRFQGDEPEFRKLMEVLEVLNDPLLSVLVLFENSRFFPYFKGKNEKFMQQQNSMIDIFRKVIDEHKATYKEGTVRDFIDAFINEQYTNDFQTDDGFSDEQLAVLVRDLFVAGTESTSSTIAWALICLLNYPQHKKLIVDEIRATFKDKGQLTLSKKDDLPLTQAFLQEVMRFKLVTPLTHRQTTESTSLNGFFIPKGTQVIANLHAVLNDPDLWPQPHLFDPSRHIDKNGKFVYSPKIIPFSVGARYCLGESLARAEYFLLFTSTLLHFDIDTVGEPPSLEGKVSNVVHLAPEFSIRARKVM